MSKLNQISSRNIIQGSDIDFNRDRQFGDEINDRITRRIIPDTVLQPNFGPRPVSTKYSLFPIIDRRTTSTVMKDKHDAYTPSSNFNPGDSAPVNGFLNNVSIESELRGNSYKLTGGDLGHKFIPSTSGPLYNNTVGNPLDIADSKHQLLFKKDKYVQSVSNLDPSIGKDLFHNNTRVQLRNT
jgi:hypothetical protein